MEPHGRALEDAYRGRRRSDLLIHREDGHSGTVPVDLFLSEEPLFLQDATVLDRCRGPVLDVGAGGGRHALPLEMRGLRVCAIDIAPRAVVIMQERGLHDVRCASFLDFAESCRRVGGPGGSPFDTVLLLGHGLGMAGDLAGLEHWLDGAAGVVADGGQILADSLDVRCTESDLHLDYQAGLEARGRYRGEMRFHLEYEEFVGEPFGWLHVDFDTLRGLAGRCGWRAEQIDSDYDGSYWCCLERIT